MAVKYALARPLKTTKKFLLKRESLLGVDGLGAMQATADRAHRARWTGYLSGSLFIKTRQDYAKLATNSRYAPRSR